MSLPDEWQDIRNAVWNDRLRRSQTPTASSGISQMGDIDIDEDTAASRSVGDLGEESYTAGEYGDKRPPDNAQLITHQNRAVVGTDYAYITDRDSQDLSSSTPVPNIFVSPKHHRSQQHPYYLEQHRPRYPHITWTRPKSCKQEDWWWLEGFLWGVESPAQLKEETQQETSS